MRINEVQHPQTHLFMVRVWVDNLGESKAEYRGKVQHVLSKEVRYFRGWPMLITVLHELINRLEGVKRK
jgi:hypothetical protein